MDQSIITAIIILVAVLLVLITSLMVRSHFERLFHRWQAEQNEIWQLQIRDARKQAINQSRAVLGGKFTEQMAPYLPQFNYDPTEARFIGTPIDLMVFPGLAQGKVKEIVIMEIKSGQNCQLTTAQQQIRGLIENGMVRWEQINHEAPPVPED